MNDSIFRFEQDLYLHLIKLSQQHPKAHEWLAKLPDWLGEIKDKSRYAHAPFYASAVARLPVLDDVTVDLAERVSIHSDWSMAQFKQSHALLHNLKPWRKGPFFVGDGADKQLHIDTEWRSDWKWQRVAKHLNLVDKHILDVGGGSGYHGFRMLGAGAASVVVIDPSCLFYHQFMAIKHFTGALPVHYIPVPLEVLPTHSTMFDVVFSMGVLYHRSSPFEHLEALKGQLVKDGTLVLETLVVDGDDNTVLVPQDRYAQMNNVYFLPSVPALTKWLTKAGFHSVECVDIDITSTDEQRATEWMTYQSLADFLDPNNPTLTQEGYPAPKRAVMIAKK